MATTVSRRRRRSSYNVRPVWMTTRRMVAAVALFTVLGTGSFGYRLVSGLAKLNHESALGVLGDVVSGGSNSKVESQVRNLKRINIAFYGYGGAGHDGAYLTDSIMLVSIQPRASGPPEVAEFSLPRDWYVPITLKNGQVVHQRINYAYSAGMDNEGPIPADQPGAGAAVADAELEKLLGVHIDHYVGVDFSAFKQGVDAVGGVDVMVPNTFTDYQYPAGECGGTHPNCAYMTVHFNAGPVHMNGTQALEFSRSRHGDNGEGSDFARSHRQQLVVAALKQRVVSLGGLGHLPDLLNALGDNVQTDLTLGDEESLYALVKNVDPATVEHVSIDNTNFLYDCGYPANCGAYYLYAHDRTLTSLHTFVANLFVDPVALASRAPITVEDGSRLGAGGATRWTQLLGELGFATKDGGPTAYSAHTQVIDNSGGRYSAAAHWLATYFGVQVTEAHPATSPPSQTVTSSVQVQGITVILGADEEHAFDNLNGNATD